MGKWWFMDSCIVWLHGNHTIRTYNLMLAHAVDAGSALIKMCAKCKRILASSEKYRDIIVSLSHPKGGYETRKLAVQAAKEQFDQRKKAGIRWPILA